MRGTKGYVDPLLTALTVDYSKGIRAKLVGAKLFPRVLVDKSAGQYAVFDRGNLSRVVDDTFGDSGTSKKLVMGGTMQPYATTQRALHDSYDLRDASQRDGPFALKDQQIVERITTQLEINQEYRIGKAIQALPGRSTALAGVGDTKANKWIGGKGDPVTAFQDAIAACAIRPNFLLVSGSVFDVLEFHPMLLAKLGEANMIKKVNEETLGKLFRIDTVVIGEGKADLGKRRDDDTLSLVQLWGDSVIFAVVDDRPDYPCAGKTMSVKYPQADAAGFIVRTFDEEGAGLLGKRIVQVGHDVDEKIVCADLIYTIKSCL